MGDPLQGAAQGAGMAGDLPKIWRWHVVAGLCLINGYRAGAELGVSQGRFTSYLCGHIPDLTMIAVDLWATLPPRAVEGAETYENNDHEFNYTRFRGFCARFEGRVTIHRMRTVDAAQLVPDESLDFVFIDADHTYDGCQADIAAWEPKVRKGGMVTGHDYNWPTVRRAVDESFPEPRIFPDKVWSWKK